MTKIVKNIFNENLLELCDIKSYDCIIVQVYRGKASVLTHYRSKGNDATFKLDKYAFMETGLDYNTASPDWKTCLERSLEEDENELYLFNSWGEFAKAAVENKWE